MPTYEYSALNSEGKKLKGLLHGDSPKQIRQQLRDQGLFPIEMHAVAENNSFKGKITTSWHHSLWNREAQWRLLELSFVFRQIATLLEAGIPLEEALGSVAEQQDQKKIQHTLFVLRDAVREGYSFAQALDRYPRTFSTIIRATVTAGEQAGKLEMVLSELADYLEHRDAITQKIRQAMIYPILMFVVSIGILSFLMVYVLPKIIDVFTQTQQDLPGITVFLLALSHGLRAYGILCVGLIISIILLAKYCQHRFVFIKNFFSTTTFKLPLIGFVAHKSNVVRYARTLGILLSSGVPVLEAMSIAGALVSNHAMKEAVLDIISDVREGNEIAKALKKTKYFSAVTLNLITTGENSGALEKLLKKAADYEELQLQNKINTLLSLLEPFITLFMGGMVLLIVLAILLPIFTLNQLTF